MTTDVGLTRITLGCELLGGADWGRVDPEQAIDAVRSAWDRGVRSFDTADVYGLGRSEVELARALGPHLADATIITKGGIAWAKDSTARAMTWRDLSPEHLGTAVRASLARLGVDVVPLYLAHWPDDTHMVEDVVATLLALRDEGLIRAFGLSNFAIDDLVRPGILAQLSAVEMEHSLIRPAHRQLALLSQTNTPALVYGALAQGLLTGKYALTHDFGKDDRRHRVSHFQDQRVQHEPTIRRVMTLAADLGRSAAQIALAWALHSGPTVHVIAGARDRAQLTNNVEALDIDLTPRMCAFLEGAAETY